VAFKIPGPCAGVFFKGFRLQGDWDEDDEMDALADVVGDAGDRRLLKDR
jgi:hypothetical protein